MKYLLSLLFIFTTLQVTAEETKNTDWVFDRANFYIENDVYFGTDDGYSTGEMFTFLYFLPEADNFVHNLLGYNTKESYSYFTFSLANQIYTPTNTNTTAFQPNDRPYAGWTYVETGLHKTTRTQLHLILKKYKQVFTKYLNWTLLMDGNIN